MIRVKSDGPTGSEFDDWNSKAERARNSMIQEFRAKGTIPDPDRYQKVWRKLKDTFLISLFNGKCAFCEADFRLANCPPDVEHYRPKNGVTESRKRIAHRGYFWLACEWYNLLLVCRNCNSGHSDMLAGKAVTHPGKAMEFPVDGARIEEPSDDASNWRRELEAEVPLLLNPYFDDPEEHIEFAFLGYPCPRNGSRRGEATIQACDLARDSLCTARREFVEDLVVKRLHRLLEVPGTSVIDRTDPFFAWIKVAFPIVTKQKLLSGGLRIDGISVELNAL